MSPSPSTLTAEQIGAIRDELERTLRRLERCQHTNGNGRPREIDQSSVGRLSRIEALQNQGLTRNLEDRERMKFDEVMQALARLAEGSFGICADCSDAIGYERLIVFPEARTCGGCRNGGQE